MRKIYVSFLIVFIAFAATFTLMKSFSSELINTILIAVGEGSRIKVDNNADPQKKKAKKAPAKILGIGGIASAAQLQVLKEDVKTAPVSRLVKQEGKQKFRRDMYVLKWAILGPFDLAATIDPFLPATAVQHETMKNEGMLNPFVPAPEGASWQNVKGLALDGKILVSEPYRKLKGKAVIYAAAEIEADEDNPDALLLLGGKDDIKVWLNGKEVFTSNPKTARRADADKIPVVLKKGKNTIVVKSAYTSWQCFFYVRFTDAKNVPLIPVQEPKN